MTLTERYGEFSAFVFTKMMVWKTGWRGFYGFSWTGGVGKRGDDGEACT